MASVSAESADETAVTFKDLPSHVLCIFNEAESEAVEVDEKHP